MDAINQLLARLLQTDGAVAVALVDVNNRSVLGQAGGGIAVDIAVTCHAELLRIGIKMEALRLKNNIEDVSIILGGQNHIVRPVVSWSGVVIHLVLDQARSNQSMARQRVKIVEQQIDKATAEAAWRHRPDQLI